MIANHRNPELLEESKIPIFKQRSSDPWALLATSLGCGFWSLSSAIFVCHFFAAFGRGLDRCD